MAHTHKSEDNSIVLNDLNTLNTLNSLNPLNTLNSLNPNHFIGKLSHHIFVKGDLLTCNNQDYISLTTKEVDIDYLKSLKLNKDSKEIKPFLTTYIIKNDNDNTFVDKIIKNIKYYAGNSSPFLLAPLCHVNKDNKKEEVYYQSGITGTGKPNEPIFMTAQRELFEETGFVIKRMAKYSKRESVVTIRKGTEKRICTTYILHVSQLEKASADYAVRITEFINQEDFIGYDSDNIPYMNKVQIFVFGTDEELRTHILNTTIIKPVKEDETYYDNDIIGLTVVPIQKLNFLRNV
jgi:hypothetical protein